jgi:hypothetical protein
VPHPLDGRLRALCDLSVPATREYGGVHDYDGQLQDLSPDGVRRALAALGHGSPFDDEYDEALVSCAEAHARAVFGELEMHRRNPLYHVSNLDLANYDRDYAPVRERTEARRRHLAGWPAAVDAAIESLDQVPAPVAEATIGAARGLAAQLRRDRSRIEDEALTAHARLVTHLEGLVAGGDPDPALGDAALARLLGVAEGMEVDLTDLARRAGAERERLVAALRDGCDQVSPGRPIQLTVRELLADHPTAEQVMEEARAITAEAIAWTAEHDLAPYDGQCLVGPAPESRRWAMAMMSWAAPFEPEGPSWYHITPPSPTWPQHEQQQWLEVFSRTTLPAVTVHEVAPGHFSHGRALRRVRGDARKLIASESFVEGWAHYTEQVALEQGFRGADPRFAIGVVLEALVRVTRLLCAIGLHTRQLDVAGAAREFEKHAFYLGPAAMSEARRGTFDPTYGRYTWGRLAILEARDRARTAWGRDFSLPRFHRALLDLGAPPLGLLDFAIELG